MTKFYESWLFSGGAYRDGHGEVHLAKTLYAYLYWLIQTQLEIKPGVAHELLNNFCDACPSRKTLHRSKPDFDKKIKRTTLKSKRWVNTPSSNSASKEYKLSSDAQDFKVKVAIELTVGSRETTASAHVFILEKGISDPIYNRQWFKDLPLKNISSLNKITQNGVAHAEALPPEHKAFIDKLCAYIYPTIPLTLLVQLMTRAFPNVHRAFGGSQKFHYLLSKFAKTSYPNIAPYKDITIRNTSEYRLICFSDFALVVEPHGFLIIRLAHNQEGHLDALRRVDKADLEISKRQASGKNVCKIRTCFNKVAIHSKGTWYVEYSSPNFFSLSSAEDELKSRKLQRKYQVLITDFDDQ